MVSDTSKPAQATELPKVKLIDVYEIHAKFSGYDFCVVRHNDQAMFYDAIWDALDNLEDGESVRVTYRKYTQEQIDEVSEND